MKLQFTFVYIYNRNNTDRISNTAYLRLLPCGEILPPSLYYNPNNYPFPQFFILTNPCYVKGTSTNDIILIKGLSLYTYTLFCIYACKITFEIINSFTNFHLLPITPFWGVTPQKKVFRSSIKVPNESCATSNRFQLLPFGELLPKRKSFEVRSKFQKKVVFFPHQLPKRE